MSEAATWVLYGKGLIGSEIERQLGQEDVAGRLGLCTEPEYIVRKSGVFDTDGDKLFDSLHDISQLPDVGFVALPSDQSDLAYDIISGHLHEGKKVITAEKGAMADYGGDLRRLSNDFQLLGVNATVGGGTRMMEVANSFMRDPNNVTQVHMMVNGTLTSILSDVGPAGGGGMPLGTAVDRAIKLGYAEPGAKTPEDVIASEAAGDIPKKTAIFMNRLGLVDDFVDWETLDFIVDGDCIEEVLEEAQVRRPIVSLYNNKTSTAQPESGIIGGFRDQIGAFTVVAGFRDVTKNPMFDGFGRLNGAGNGIVIGLGPNESDGTIELYGQGAGPGPTVNTMLDDYLSIRDNA